MVSKFVENKHLKAKRNSGSCVSNLIVVLILIIVAVYVMSKCDGEHERILAEKISMAEKSGVLSISPVPPFFMAVTIEHGGCEYVICSGSEEKDRDITVVHKENCRFCAERRILK